MTYQKPHLVEHSPESAFAGCCTGPFRYFPSDKVWIIGSC
jgi:hypothetical protein